MELITQAPRGTQDILPGQSEKWQTVEQVLREEAALHGFAEVRTPVFEHTELFQRGVGDTTDVVQKEMYTFRDRGDRSITLRPEGTAGATRALLEHGLYAAALPQKLWYETSCYRYEKAQKGRLREFHQFGVEMYGSADPLADAEVISIADSIFKRLGVKDLALELNSIGCPTCRAAYTKALQDYFGQYKDQLCETCLSRLDRNPMRILDCKSEICHKIGENAPSILDYLCEDCKAHFEKVKAALTALGISYQINDRIVRGLDYYTRTVFEFTTNDLGSQGTVCGGGRYDGLVEELGGPAMPALGFGLGLDRLLLLMEAQKIEFPQAQKCDLYIASIGDAARQKSLVLAAELRSSGIAAAFDDLGRGLKAQMKYANKIGARYSMVLGDDELTNQKVSVKNMETGEQNDLPLNENFAKAFAAMDRYSSLIQAF
ncbi:MAG: histidine--tRNA ligase [Oscillospiraceae bacterium]|jgi:histidyl-tRNA synthetase|nr:histidine--tRNA ligase [Oscillospiraceae bacterium]MDD3260564.1 histidine--tRNA ligase [Oscillospiraceae bacterium]